MTGLTSFVADLPALVGSLRSHRVLRDVRGSRPPFGHQKFVLLGARAPRLVVGKGCPRRRFVVFFPVQSSLNGRCYDGCHYGR